MFERLRITLEEWGLDANLLLDIIIPVAILLFGWLAAIFIGGMVRRALNRTQLDDKIARLIVGDGADAIDSARWTGKAVYYLVMLFVLMAFLARLGLTVATEPINHFLSTVFEFAPRVLGAAAILLGAWIVARVCRKVIVTALMRTKLDERIAEESTPGDDDDDDDDDDSDDEEERHSPSKAVGEVVYWLVFLLFLPAALGALQLTGLLEPLQTMLHRFLGFAPNLASAAVIFAAGWFAARMIQRIVTGLLSSVGLDRMSKKYGVSKALGDRTLSQIIGMVVHVLIIIPVAVAALNALQLDAITGPASAMLNTMLSALPQVFGAGLVMGVAFFIGRFIAGLMTNILRGAGFDRIPVKLGLAKTEPAKDAKGPSHVAGDVVLIAVMLFALIEAANLMGFERLADILNEFLALAGHVGLGLVIVSLGMFLAEIAAKAIRASEVTHGDWLATAARIAILGLAGSMGLRQMGLANEIIVLAFGIALGSVAVAFALAFGLGAREQAGEMVSEWRARWRKQ